MIDRAMLDVSLTLTARCPAALMRQGDPFCQARIENALIEWNIEYDAIIQNSDFRFAHDMKNPQKIGMIFSASKETSLPLIPTSGSAGNSMP